MTNKEKYKRTFSALHASGNRLKEEEIMKKRKNKYMKKVVAAAATVFIVSGSMTAAYAADLGGIQEKLTVWFRGQETQMNVEKQGDNSYKYSYTDTEGRSQEFMAGGVEIDDQGNERPATAQEVLDFIGDEVIFDDSGKIFFYCASEQKKVDITSRFDEKGICRIAIKEGENIMYYEINKEGGYTGTIETPENARQYTLIK